MVGLVKVAIRNREQLATLRVRDGVIVLETMIWPDEVRDAALRLPRRGRRPAPAGARRWPSPWSTAWPATSTPTHYTDDYREALQQVIDAKVEGPRGRRGPQAEPDTPAMSSI